MIDFKNRQLLITGGAGFVGINLVNRLYEFGTRLTVVDLPSADFSSLPQNVNLIRSDIRDIERYSDDLSNAEIVFHLAARTDLNGKSIKDYAVNFLGTQLILEALRNSKAIKKFLYVSTQLVTGIFNETRFINENEPYRTKTLYGESKILAEKIVKNICYSTNIPYVIIRPTSVFGDHGKIPYRDFFLKIKQRHYFHIGKANNLISMCYVGNLVDQMIFLAGSETPAGLVCYGNDHYPYTMRQFADAAAAYFGQKIPTVPDIVAIPSAYILGILKLFKLNPPLYPFRLRNIKSNYCYDIGNVIRLGYFPPYSLRDGIRATLNWYMTHDPDFQIP